MHLTRRWSERPPALAPRSAWLNRFRFGRRSLPVAVAHLVLVRPLPMHLVMFDIDGTLFAHSRTCLVSPTSTPIGHTIHARRIPVSFTMFSRRALAGHRQRRKFRAFASTSLICLRGFHLKLLSQQLQERLYYYRAWLIAGSIESHLLLGRGVIRPVSRWQVLACATMIIQQRRATMRLIERLSSSCPCKGQPSGIARLAALFMLETGCGMLVRVAASAFRSLALARAVARHGCRQRELFASSLISVTRIYF